MSTTESVVPRVSFVVRSCGANDEQSGFPPVATQPAKDLPGGRRDSRFHARKARPPHLRIIGAVALRTGGREWWKRDGLVRPSGWDSRHATGNVPGADGMRLAERLANSAAVG